MYECIFKRKLIATFYIILHNPDVDREKFAELGSPHLTFRIIIIKKKTFHFNSVCEKLMSSGTEECVELGSPHNIKICSSARKLFYFTSTCE